MKRLLSTSVFALALLFVTGLVAHAGNIVNNGDFVTDDFTGWTQSGDPGLTFVAPSTNYGLYAPSGNVAVLGQTDFDGHLSQLLTTVATQTYQVSYYLASDGLTPNDFSASWDGTALSSLTDIPNTNGWIEYTFTVTGTGSDTIMFSFMNDPGYLGLANISVSSIPEPNTMLLLCSGLACLFGLRKKCLN
ncbi:MAG: PEP-CTERM sorting domain-containing protein [Syntrophobacteraceae bacterium]|nr:PEP-CTERM sorting domain-containing protein [Syntrophobacteraceae bacterium]